MSDLHKIHVRQYGNQNVRPLQTAFEGVFCVPPTFGAWTDILSLQGQPVLFVHGGPGGGCDGKDAQRFDPEVYRQFQAPLCFARVLRLTPFSRCLDTGIVLVDQRGSGESLPPAELKENTTWDLVEDMEKVRKHIGGIEKWHVFGGSWSVPSLLLLCRCLKALY